jgi:hypothetical protein
MLHSVHPSFLVWAAVLGAAAAVGLAAVFGGLVRRHLARLAVCLAAGAAAAFGVTAWADGQRHAALAAAAHAGHGHGHALSVDGQLAAAFTVITVAVAAVAFIVSALAGRRLGRPYAQHDLYGQEPARRGRYSSARRGW